MVFLPARQGHELRAVVTRAPLHAHFQPGTGKTLVVSFAGVGHSRTAPQPPEFRAIASQRGENPVLFIADSARSWLNAPGLIGAISLTIERTQAETGAERLVGIGNSMGGFMALEMTRHLPFDVVCAISPQVSVHPDHVPEEHRWRFLRNRIGNYRVPKLGKHLPHDPQIFALHADHPDEMIHARRFPIAPNIAHFLLPGYDHGMARQLKSEGHLRALVGHAIRGHKRKFALRVKAAGGRFIQREDRNPASSQAA
ncbi:hypothetical protein [Thioclava pacifica]|uniref:AB hydrolase-1 domain-containing protein n=1 Tax=Thioclava pacifica DSM 10166 TaxID=1353537 RepID=A0A074JFU1_9RHOB|nr:hypothetical protein [Thioclava pacifica]KEO56491.1 hypothetical protein TP2_02890 [Thioclava pacifica DSM 10166]